MHLSTVYSSLGLMAGLATALPHAHKARQSTGAQTVVYWGQNGGGTIENNDLSTYCSSTSGIDIIVLAFLYQWGNGADIPSGTIGQSCFISTAGEGQNCDALASAITTCQSAGIKVLLSLGGATASYSLSSDSEAESIGNYLWQAYGNSGNSSGVQRPFGDVVVDGFDFDIEVNRGSEYYPAMISALRTNFETDSSRTYLISSAPQCPIPEPNRKYSLLLMLWLFLGVVIGNATFDYIWPQFYNNNNYTYPCALPINGNAPFNYDGWLNFTASGPSKDAKIFIGVPASPLAANGSPTGETYYATPDQLLTIVNSVKDDSRFGGVMMWSAGFSDSNVNNGCTYAQEVNSILTKGAVC
ncbi:glycoside hydrolase family 18 protein [Annulohypoxylon truncatum]|uniref:glycoside hydrolase family 18 protein n=1 Tax=Annulohypoxylon truncatum TaxID=327061 RepID=UPI0020079CC7|nr:glycoside hydrolase family 18 protein [Annulohypoxylon truncatum]KAI1214550.1 glycoside hydrolase family 18 protein [Annulohypoxylon truncatum]